MLSGMLTFFFCYVNRVRAPLEPGQKLLITLRFLATGTAYRSLRFELRVPHNTISVVVREVCDAIFRSYRDEAFSLPATTEDWRKVARGYSQKWNFHHCVGAIDGKHIAIRKPPKSGSVYYNYKGFYSIVLLALVDSNYTFMWADVGAPGSCSDGGVFNRGSLKRRLADNTLGLPPPEPIPGDDKNIPYFIIGDDAFPMATYLMKPFPLRLLTPPQRIFNYRLSRGRNTVENSFGILANRWRCLLTTLNVPPRTARKVVKGCITLHNVMRKRYAQEQAGEMDREDGDGNVIRGRWRDGRTLTSNRGLVGNRAMRAAKEQRNYLMDFYNSPAGSLPWQDRIVNVQREDPYAPSESESEANSDVD